MKDTTPDLTRIPSTDLERIQHQLNQEITQRKKREISRLRRDISNVATRLNIPLQPLIEAVIQKVAHDTSVSASSRSRATTVYQNPDNPSQTWVGRGRPPRWYSALIDQGYTPDQLKCVPATTEH
ncbi:H-NS family nucleoid-associated regulatory protein [Marinobacterium sp. BA1]|uniref:H-NS histone family protein n=1 Tax=Marinobacterium sp. BA1 TaxID=3138931 RepID=UPI0034E8595F